MALPDGGVAVARMADYHVDWYSPSGVRTAGRPVATPRIPVTSADKEQVKKERLAAMRSAMPRSRPGGPPSVVAEGYNTGPRRTSNPASANFSPGKD